MLFRSIFCRHRAIIIGKFTSFRTYQYIYKPISPTARQTADITVSSPAIREAKADIDGQFSLFSFDSEDELLPQPNEIRGKEMNPENVSQPQARKPRKPATLIVVPTSLLHNWRREAKRFTTLSMVEYTSTSILSKTHPEKFFRRFHLVFTTYGTMRKNINILRSYCFEYIVLDESQNIKNSE